jgi:hypothetical protein
MTMKLATFGFSAVLFGLIAAPTLATADQKVLFQHKNWMVAVNSFDDGTIACQAAVDEGAESFTIWVFQDQSVRLQFYSTDWNYTDGETADLQVEIDHRGAWTLTGANLTGNSALFDLPDSNQSSKFIVEVAQGKSAHLRDSDGAGVRDYPLAGSKASIAALIECADGIK